jgi:hypothetical protein
MCFLFARGVARQPNWSKIENFPGEKSVSTFAFHYVQRINSIGFGATG